MIARGKPEPREMCIHQNPRGQEGSGSSLSLTWPPTDITVCVAGQVEGIKQCLLLAITEESAASFGKALSAHQRGER